MASTDEEFRIAIEGVEELRGIGLREFLALPRTRLETLNLSLPCLGRVLAFYDTHHRGGAAAGPAGAFSAVHSTVARPAPQLLPPPPPTSQEEQLSFIVQLKLHQVDGTRASLSVHRGFRKFIQTECRQRGLRGYVWRVPRVHAKVLAVGTRSQVDSLLSFVQDLQQNGFIDTFTPERPQFAVLNSGFDILHSTRQHVETGAYSDRMLDDVVSTASADLPVLRGTPSPHSLDQERW